MKRGKKSPRVENRLCLTVPEAAAMMWFFK